MTPEQWTLANIRAYGWLFLLTVVAVVATLVFCLVP
jgi:hypothetical protein